MSKELITQMMAGHIDQETFERRFAIHSAIVNHRTFFCPCGSSLDQNSAQLFQFKTDGDWRDSTIFCGKHAKDQLAAAIGAATNPPVTAARVVDWNGVVTET